MLDGSRGHQGLILEWDTGRMEEEGCCCCCCGGEAGPHRQDALIQLLRQKARRQTRIAQFFCVVVLLLVSGILAVLAVFVLGGRGHPSPDRQLMMHPDSNSPGARFEQRQPREEEDLKNPTAMLTVPIGNNINGENLEWESVTGNAFCQGGFNYSEGFLVVPKTGLYRIFLQITYEDKDDFQCDSGDDLLKLTNRVFLIRDSYKTDVQLLSSVDSVNCSMKHWSKSLYTAGIYSLEANCRLSVTSSKPELITKREHQVFFGAELLR